MRRLLALAVLVAFLPTANAQDKGKAEFSPSAEYRARYFWTQNPTANETSKGQDSMVASRFKLGANYKANEKFSAHLTALHAATFGQDVNTDEVGNMNTNSAENVLMVNEAYANWMFSDDMSFKFGRQNFQIADGSVMATNDWEQNPTAFEGLVGNWEAEFGRFQAFAFKYRELGVSSSAKDGEHNAYGLNFDLKTMPNMLKAVNVHVIKDAADATAGTAGTGSNQTAAQGLMGQDTIRYGAMVTGEFGIFDAKVNYEGTTGKYKSVAAGPGAVTSTDSNGTMYQVEVGAKFDGFMGSRVFALYHSDSGSKTANDGKAYDAYFYEKHANAGLMDLVNWGNLTYVTVGWTMKPGDNTDAGIMYHMFSRTEKGVASSNTVFAAGDVNKEKLGDEIDLWAEHRYDGGLSTVLRLGYFTPGDYLTSNAATTKADDNIMQVMVEGKLTF